MEERNFKGIWIPKEIWLTNELSLQEKVVLVEIDSLDDEEKGCFASNKYFAEFFKITNGRVSQIINQLQKKGYIDIKYNYKGKEITERLIRVKRPPYPEVFNKLNTYLENDDRGIKYSKQGYLENAKDNNITTNNINNNNNSKERKEDIESIVHYLNLTLGTKYRECPSTVKHINARLDEGYTLDDFFDVIDNKYEEWKDTDMEKYLRPDTLFGTKFDIYLNQKRK
jgi:uncharacterized phage protein (TIGR02220 family)